MFSFFSKRHRGIWRLTFILFLVALALSQSSFASTPALDVRVIEFVSEIIAYDQSLGEDNVTTESRAELGENRTGTSRTGITLHDMEIYGIINISNVETTGNTDIISINVTLNNTENITNITLQSAPAGNYLVYNISTGEQPDRESTISIFIASLQAGDTVLFNFTVNGTGEKGEPINFTEEYESWRVMSGRSINITLNVTNSLTENVLITDLEITKTPEQYDRIGGGYVYFNYTDIAGEDSANAILYADGQSRSILAWNASNRDLTQGETRQITFKSWAPRNISVSWDDEEWATWMSMGNLSASFKYNGSISGLRIQDVEATATAASFSVSKDRWNETHWNSTLNISNEATAPLDYNVTYVSIWATQYQQYSDPANTATWVTNTNVSAFGFSDILGPYANASWTPGFNLSDGTSNDSFSIMFNYSLVPIVWTDVNFMILKDNNQIYKVNSTESLQDAYLFIEEVYVLMGGYLVKATKTITPLSLATANNSYQVNVTIENIGSERTPNLVTMFDLLPKDFNPLIWSTDALATNRSVTDENEIEISDSSGSFTTLALSDMVLGYADSGEITGGEYDGYWGYYVDLVGLNATSDGDGMYDPSNATKEVSLHYKIAGNTTLASIENAYIVGVDPIRLDGASPSRSVASTIGLSSSTIEYAVIITSLLVSVALLSSGFGLFRRKY
jgi:hypothetical protein